MQATETALKGCFIIEPRVFKDDRGYFFESFNQKVFEELIGQNVNFVQDNQSFSQYGVIRGIHFQQGEHAQAKLVRVLAGEVLDVAVDLRKNSETYGQHVAVKLTAANHKQLFVPRGFGHGFSVLSKTAIFAYKCDNYYHKASEGGIVYNDPRLAIDWGIPAEMVQVSEKDIELDKL
tara:strand:+ start:3153 stop:3683 length:531 start_codon:yes stop_codon:yes gene_type:complete